METPFCELGENAEASILLLGESGTGKSVVARSVHRQSHLADKPFITVSCPSLSRGTAGKRIVRPRQRRIHGRPAETIGAKSRRRQGGPSSSTRSATCRVEIQPKLLRLLQEREYERVGENA